RRPIPVSQYSASVSTTYLYRFGNDEPFQPSNAQTAHGQFIPAAAFPTAAYCGHCHAAAYKQWQDSLHRNAFREPFYQKNVKLLNDSKGIEYSRHCEGCHNPIALFSGALTPHSELTRSFDDGLTCSVCHSIVKLQPMRGNGAYVLAAPAVMTDAAGKRIPSLVPDAQILAHPDRHAHAVMQPFYRSAEYCGTCHNSNLPVSLTGHKWLKGFGTYDEWQASSYSQRSPLPFYEKPLTSCQNCHMAAEPAGPGEMAAHAGSIASQPAQSAPLALRISTRDSTVRAGAEVVIHVTLVNHTTRDVVVPAVSTPGQAETHFQISVHDAKGRPAPPTAYARNEARRPIPGSYGIVRVKPGESYSDDIVLTKLFDLTRGGDFTVQVAANWQSAAPVTSNSLSVKVRN